MPHTQTLTHFFGLPLQVYATGGGCQALRGQLPDGHYVLITDSGGSTVPEPTDWMVGLYSPEWHTLLCVSSDGERSGYFGLKRMKQRFHAYCHDNHLEPMPAPTLLASLLTDLPGNPRVAEHCKWLVDFICYWNLWEGAEQALWPNAPT